MAEDKNQPVSPDKQLLVPGEKSVVPVKRDLVETGVDLQNITEVITHNGTFIAAGENREPVRVLQRPGYLKWEHRFDLVEVDISKTRKSPPVFFAVYLMGIGDPVKEVRSIKLPVQTRGVLRDTEDEMLRQMIADGLDPNEVRQYTPEYRTKSIVGVSSGFTLMELARALKYGHFETSMINHELSNSEAGRLQSGWKENDYWPLVIWSNWKAPVCVLFDKGNKIDITKEAIISPPFTQQMFDATDPSTIGLVNKIVANNQKIRS